MLPRLHCLAYLLVALRLIAPIPLHAQGLAGYVTDTLQRPLYSAIVVVSGVGDTLKPHTLRTSLDGRFVITKLAAGRYTVTVRRIGYREQTTNVTVADGQSALLRVTLQATAPTFDTVRARLDHNRCMNNTLDGFLCRRQAVSRRLTPRAQITPSPAPPNPREKTWLDAG